MSTHRGTCQVCGAQQAVNNKTGMMAKHGYTVEHGFFEGECPGSHNLPLEADRTMTDNIIRPDRQAARIEQIDDGIKMVTYRYTDRETRKEKMVKLIRTTSSRYDRQVLHRHVLGRRCRDVRVEAESK